jgi:hypothetical protein
MIAAAASIARGEGRGGSKAFRWDEAWDEMSDPSLAADEGFSERCTAAIINRGDAK